MAVPLPKSLPISSAFEILILCYFAHGTKWIYNVSIVNIEDTIMSLYQKINTITETEIDVITETRNEIMQERSQFNDRNQQKDVCVHAHACIYA